MKNEKKHLLALLNLSRASGRNVLSGILGRLNREADWSLSILQIQEHTPEETITLLENSKADGFISTEMEVPQVAAFFERSKIPLVVIGTRRICIPGRTDNLVFVTFDEDRIGEAGARFLGSLGSFASYSFIHYTEKPYAHLSFLRKRGFRRALLKTGHDCTSYGEPGEETAIDREGLERHLAEIPKPAAIMVGCDKRTVEVLDAARRQKLRVPGDISIVSVDNDEILCNSMRPTITSIDTAIGATGATAVEELKRLFNHHSAKPRRIVIDSRPQVTVRESSAVVAPGLHLANRALKFIDENASREVTIQDVVRHLGVSRRLADLRFREFTGHSLLEAITEARLRVVKRKLRTTKSTITRIAAECGFRNENYLKILFKRRTGMTMSDFRRRNSQ